MNFCWFVLSLLSVLYVLATYTYHGSLECALHITFIHAWGRIHHYRWIAFEIVYHKRFNLIYFWFEILLDIIIILCITAQIYQLIQFKAEIFRTQISGILAPLFHMMRKSKRPMFRSLRRDWQWAMTINYKLLSGVSLKKSLFCFELRPVVIIIYFLDTRISFADL